MVDLQRGTQCACRRPANQGQNLKDMQENTCTRTGSANQVAMEKKIGQRYKEGVVPGGRMDERAPR